MKRAIALLFSAAVLAGAGHSNTVQFGQPDTTRNSNQFGIISTQANSPRQMQMGLRLIF